jgi:hypothetical protein
VQPPDIPAPPPPPPAPLPEPPPPPATPVDIPVPTDWDMWGSLADWSTSLIALLAFAAAVLATRATIKTNTAQQETLDLQRKQFEHQREDQRRAQASKVTWWIIPKVPGSSEAVGAQILNASESPIFEPRFLALGDDSTCLRAGPLWLPTVHPLADKDEIYFTIDTGAARLVLYFKDSSGVSWVREQGGDLHEQSTEDVALADKLYAEGLARKERELADSAMVPDEER